MNSLHRVQITLRLNSDIEMKARKIATLLGISRNAFISMALTKAVNQQPMYATYEIEDTPPAQSAG